MNKVIVLACICALGCGARPESRRTEHVIVAQEAAGSAAIERCAAPPSGFEVGLLPEGWSKVPRSECGNLGEARSARYEDPVLGASMTITLLTPSDSPSNALCREGEVMRKDGWSVHSLDDDESNGIVALAAYKDTPHGTFESLVRAVAYTACPDGSPLCIVVFAGRWPLDRADDGRFTYDIIEGSLVITKESAP